MSEFRQALAEAAETESSTDLVIAPAELQSLAGLVVDLTSENQVAQALSEIQLLKAKLSHAERVLREAIAERSRVLGTKTFHVTGVGTVEIKGDKKVRWDAEKLQDLLRQAGADEALISEIVIEQVSYKVDARRAARAAKANTDYAQAIESCREEEPVLPTVSISS